MTTACPTAWSHRRRTVRARSTTRVLTPAMRAASPDPDRRSLRPRVPSATVVRDRRRDHRALALAQVPAVEILRPDVLDRIGFGSAFRTSAPVPSAGPSCPSSAVCSAAARAGSVLRSRSRWWSLRPDRCSSARPPRATPRARLSPSSRRPSSGSSAGCARCVRARPGSPDPAPAPTPVPALSTVFVCRLRDLVRTVTRRSFASLCACESSSRCTLAPYPPSTFPAHLRHPQGRSVAVPFRSAFRALSGARRRTLFRPLAWPFSFRPFAHGVRAVRPLPSRHVRDRCHPARWASGWVLKPSAPGTPSGRFHRAFAHPVRALRRAFVCEPVAVLSGARAGTLPALRVAGLRRAFGALPVASIASPAHAFFRTLVGVLPGHPSVPGSRLLDSPFSPLCSSTARGRSVPSHRLVAGPRFAAFETTRCASSGRPVRVPVRCLLRDARCAPCGDAFAPLFRPLPVPFRVVVRRRGVRAVRSRS